MSKAFINNKIISIFFVLLFQHSFAQDESESLTIIANGSPSERVNPMYGDATADVIAVSSLFESLMTHEFEDDYKLVKALVDDIQVSDDLTIYTIRLKPDLKFSDGEPLTAADVVFSYHRYVKSVVDGKAKDRGLLNFVSGYQDIISANYPVENLGVEQIDRLIVRFSLVEPDPFFLDKLGDFSLAILPSHKVRKSGDEWLINPPYVVSGAYILESWSETQLEAKKNPNYFDAANVDFDRLKIYFPNTTKSASRLMQENDADMVEQLGPDALELAKRMDNWEVKHEEQNGIERLNFLAKSKPLGHVNIRRAIHMVLNVEAVMRENKDLQRIINGVVPSIEVPTPDFIMPPYEARIKQAKILLEEAGHNAENPLFLKLGSIGVNSSRSYLRQLVLQLKEINVHVEIVGFDGFKDLIDASNAGEIDMSVYYWVYNFADPGYFLKAVADDKGFDWKNSQTPRVHDLLTKIENSSTLAERELLATKVTELIINNSYVVPFFKLAFPILHKPKLDLSLVNSSFPHVSKIRLSHQND